MKDRGTLLAGATIAVATIGAGVAFFFIQAEERAQRQLEEAHMRADAEHQRAEASRQQIVMNPNVGAKPAGEKKSAKEALSAGGTFLILQQSPDGAWRSETDPSLRSGRALTPLAVCALQQIRGTGFFPLIGRNPIDAGCEFLAKLVKPDGTIDVLEGELEYPVYTAAYSVIALSHVDQQQQEKARDAWLRFLLQHQLTEQRGWKADDSAFGGWGYSRVIPTKPEPGKPLPPLSGSNVSATLVALEALTAAGVRDRIHFEKALSFVRRCQYFKKPQEPMPADGGFSSMPASGLAQPSDSHSYGSATADGLRALRLCGETDSARLDAAQLWFQNHFTAKQHPGQFTGPREPLRDALDFYYAATVSKVLREGNRREINGMYWAEAVSAELVKRQRQDGGWVNSVSHMRENDVIVATSHAVFALSNCDFE